MNDELGNVLAKYVGSQEAEALMRALNDGGAIGPLVDRDICFVLLEFSVQEEPELLAAIASAADLAAENDAIVDAIVSNLMVVVFGLVGSPTSHKSFIDAVLSRHGSNVKIVYAVGPARVGNLGNAKRMSYTFIHPAFSKALALLPSTPVGEAREVA